MTGPNRDQPAGRSVLSWESVVDSDDSASTETSTPSEPTGTPTALDESAAPAADSNADEIELAPISLTIAPLSLDPLPSAPADATTVSTPPSAAAPPPPVLGEIHLDLSSIKMPTDFGTSDLPVTPPVAHAPAPVSDPAPVSAEVKISPLDMPDLRPSGVTPIVARDDVTDPPLQSVALQDPDPSTSVPVTSGLEAPISQTLPVQAPPAPPRQEAPAVAGALPNDPVATGSTPTTVIPQTSDDQFVPPITLPQTQPNQFSIPRSTAARGPVTVPVEPAKRRKAKKQRSGGGGLGMFFTLLVLVGLVVGAILYGRPYLFPDKWEPDAKPYGEAVEAARGTEIPAPLSLVRQPPTTYSVALADSLLGDWESQMPMWRSFGLVNRSLDAPLLRDLIDGWIDAYYSSDDGVIYADEALSASAIDAAIVEAMAAAALDQDTSWSSALDDVQLDASALIRAQVIDASRTTAAATAFGVAESERRIDVAAFLPPVLEYQLNAPMAFSELVPESGVLLDAMVDTSMINISSEPELADGETSVSNQQPVARSFWYLVLASYTDAPTAYTATNAMVNSSLATTDRSGRACSYGTFSGTEGPASELVDAALQQWATNVPAEMNAIYTVLPDGTMQLETCDPGVGFESTARFGVARELTRWRLVELAALENVDQQIGTPIARAAEVARVQESLVAMPLMTLPFDTSDSESARLARIAAGSSGGAGTEVDPESTVETISAIDTTVPDGE